MRRLPALLFLLAAAFPAASRAADVSAPVNGIVERYSARQRSFTVRTDDGQQVPFLWNHDTRFTGVVERGARVSVRYVVDTDGRNLARTVGVLR